MLEIMLVKTNPPSVKAGYGPARVANQPLAVDRLR